MKKRVLYTVLMLMLLSSLTACGGSKKETGGEASTAPAPTETVTENTTEPTSTQTPESTDSTETPTLSPAAETTMPEETKLPEAESKEQEVTLCIGMEGMIKEYKYSISGELTAEKLIAGIADMTGWNLDLADKVTSGKGGMTVCFANTSSLFVGPPEKQKKEFRVYDSEQLIMTILDSVKETLQYNFVDEKLGDTSSLDIYFCQEGDKELKFDDINKYVPLDQPYTELKSSETVPSGKLKGKFMGIADPTTVEIKIGKKFVAYQIHDEKVMDAFSEMEEGESISFQVSEEDGENVITKVY